MKIAITGGHLTPAVATIDALRKLDPKIKFIWLGRRATFEGDKTLSAEYTTITSLGIKFIELKAGRFQRKFTKFTVPTLLKVPQGFWDAFFILKREKPNLLLSFGGYLSTPAVISARILRIPIFIHEQSVRSGFANRVNARFANRVAISWPETLADFPIKKTLLVGNPIREAVFKKSLSPFAENRERKLAGASFLADKDFSEWVQNPDSNTKFTVFVTGGNQGSHFLNQILIPILYQLAKNYFLIIQSGSANERGDFLSLKDKVRELRLEKDVFITEYVVENDIGFIYSISDFLLSRSGANTVSEILTLGKPAILIPLPWAGSQEQKRNAQIVEESGLGIVLEQENLTPEKLILEIYQFSKNLTNFKKHKEGARKLVKVKAADLLAKEIILFLQSRERNLNEKG